MPRTRTKHGFTLLELLVVVGIIGLLIGLLVPTLSRAMLTVRTTKTRAILKNLSLGLQAFKTDFGAYPPSRPYRASDPTSGQRLTGRANLAYYLLGPGGAGWGTSCGLLPFSNSRPSRSYGPYHRVGRDEVRYSDLPGRQDEVDGLLDGFTPPGVILYFRAFEESRMVTDAVTGRQVAVPVTRYDVTDNGTSPDAKTNYASEEYFENCVTSGEIRLVDKETKVPRYVDWDYLLVSPGPDGRYGAILRDEDGNIEPVERRDGSYDDLGNWN